MPDFTNKRGENRSLGQSTTSNCNGGMIPEDGEREWMTLRRRGSKPGKTSLVQSSINFPLAKLNRHPGNSHLPQGPVGATDSWLQKGTLLHSGNSTSPAPVLVLAHRVAPRWVLGNWTANPVHPNPTASWATSKAVVATSLREVLLPLCSGETPPGVLCPTLVSPAEENTIWTIWSRCRTG